MEKSKALPKILAILAIIFNINEVVGRFRDVTTLTSAFYESVTKKKIKKIYISNSSRLAWHFAKICCDVFTMRQ